MELRTCHHHCHGGGLLLLPLGQTPSPPPLSPRARLADRTDHVTVSTRQRYPIHSSTCEFCLLDVCNVNILLRSCRSEDAVWTLHSRQTWVWSCSHPGARGGQPVVLDVDRWVFNLQPQNPMMVTFFFFFFFVSKLRNVFDFVLEDC